MNLATCVSKKLLAIELCLKVQLPLDHAGTFVHGETVAQGRACTSLGIRGQLSMPFVLFT